MAKNKNTTQETGRSMVEMLGVLAVIGVLSITGISGYTTAMNKHKANQILDAASKRAVAVSTQIQRGNTNPTLGEFDENEVGGATFDEEVIVSGDKFTIGYTLTDDNVRNQIKSIAGTDGIIRGITDSGIIYNDDLSTEVRASDFDNDSTNCDTTKYTWCSGSGRCLEGTNQTCTCSGTRPACKKCDTTKGSYVADTELDTHQDTCTSTKVCNNGACVPAATCDGTVANLKNCTTKDACEATAVGGIWIAPSGKTAFCAKLIEDDVDWCTARTTKCGGIAHMVLLDDLGCSTSSSTCSLEELSGKYFWTADCYGETCDDSSTCDSDGAWVVLDGGDVFASLRDRFNYALCK